MKTAIFITVRLDSSRLPNKAINTILNKTVLELIITRAKCAQEIDEIIVCTSTREIDDIVVQIAKKLGIKFYRGSLSDKLDRWNKAAKNHSVDYIVTFDGDDLFCDPYLIDLGAKQIRSGQFDFIEAPKGLVCGGFTYAFTAKALDKVCSIKASDDTEMMWTYFKDTGMFKVGELEGVDDIYFSDNIRLTLDYPEDLVFFKKVFEHFNCVNNDVPLKDIMKYLNANPEVPKINFFRQKEFLENQKNKTKLILKNK